MPSDLLRLRGALASYLRHTHRGDRLAVAAAAPVILAPLLLVHEDLPRAALLDDRAAYPRAVDERRAHPHRAPPPRAPAASGVPIPPAPSPPVRRTSVNSTGAPTSPASRSMRTTSPGATRYCFPPVRMTA